MLDRNNRNLLTECRLFVLNRNSCYYISVTTNDSRQIEV